LAELGLFFDYLEKKFSLLTNPKKLANKIFSHNSLSALQKIIMIIVAFFLQKIDKRKKL